jgi:peptidoglycan pentaglycine glycine transferase (the first glycine)
MMRQPYFALMQSWEWGEFKRRLGWKVIRLAVEQDGEITAGTQLFIRPLPFILSSLLYIPRGPIISGQDYQTVEKLFSAIHAIGREWKAVCLRIEPAIEQSDPTSQLFIAHGFRPGKFTNQPQATIIVDLQPGREELLARMRKSKRRSIHRAQRAEGLHIRKGGDADLPAAIQLINNTARRAGFPSRAEQYYIAQWNALSPSGQLIMHVAEYGGKVIAVSLDAICGDKAAALHGASLEEYHHLNANDILLWEFMCHARAAGCTNYDLWGIPDEIAQMLARGEQIPENLEGGLWGVYHFKKGFGGEVTCFTGVHDYIYDPFLYGLMQIGLVLAGSIDTLVCFGEHIKQAVKKFTRLLKPAS